MRTNGHRPRAGVKILNREEGKKLLDCEARRYLKMSGDEFVRKWKAKEFDDPDRNHEGRVSSSLCRAKPLV
jgi:hypothetical protein